MTAELIVAHVWRPMYDIRGLGPVRDRPCSYMACRRTRAEHARAVGGHRPVRAGAL